MRVVVLGGGPGGYAAAIRCAQRGDRVTLIEARELGGTCLNRGCIPTKVMAEAARLRQDVARAADFGLRVQGVALESETLLTRRARVVATLVGGLTQLLKGHGVEVVRGRGCLVPGPAGAPPLVQVGSETFGGDALVLAPGSRPSGAPFPGGDIPGVVDSDGLLALDRLPASLCIVGGGVIGCEFASIYAALGVPVELVEVAPQLLPAADEEVSRRLAAAFRRRGIGVRTGVSVAAIRPGPRVEWNGGSLAAEVVLVAIGRRPNTEGLGLEAAGVCLDRGAVAVDAQLQTTAAGVWAVGDAIGAPMLAHAAFAQAEVAAAAMHGEPATWGERPVPNPVFTSPEVAWVGLTEQAARERGIAVRIGRFPFPALGRAQATGETDGFFKVIASAADGRVLGAHVVGGAATDLLASGGLATALGLGVADVAGVSYGHPTFAEGFAEAAGAALGRPLHILGR